MTPALRLRLCAGASVTQVADVEEGLVLLAAVHDLLNQTWARPEEIQPMPEGRRVPRPLDVYELLPRTKAESAGSAPCHVIASGVRHVFRRTERSNPWHVRDCFAILKDASRAGYRPPHNDTCVGVASPAQ